MKVFLCPMCEHFADFSNCLSPGGRLRTKLLKGPTDFSYGDFICMVRERVLGFQILQYYRPFSFFEKASLWWVGGCVGCDYLPPSIFFIFRYIHKYDMLITSLVSIIITTIKPKVMINLSFNIWKFKADNKAQFELKKL